jgi:hypothetical protein
MSLVLLIQPQSWMEQIEICGRLAAYAQSQTGSTGRISGKGVAGESSGILDAGLRRPITCPGCGKEQERPDIGPWKKRFLRLMRVRLYRCASCGQRFDESARPTSWQTAFLSPTDDRRFEDLVRDIARDEREQGEPSEQNKGVRRPEDWPAVGGTGRNRPRR